MNRLIERDDSGRFNLKGVAWEKLREGQVITKDVSERLYGALCKLKDYEDTDCTPDEVNDLVEFDKSNTQKYLLEIANHRWIPAGEKLPEDDIFVIVQVNGKPLPNIDLDNALQMGCHSDDGWEISEWTEWENPDVVAWMPLPEPYRP